MTPKIGKGRAAMIDHPFSLAGKVALVTGAVRGLGFEMAKALARAGARVAINGRDEGRLREAAGRAGHDGVTLETVRFDAADPASAGALAGFATRHGRLDVFISNVGLRNRKPLFDFTLDEVRALIEADLIGPFTLAREGARLMVPRKTGRIILVTSVAGPFARAGDAAYTTAKGGLAALTKALAVELGTHAITVNHGQRHLARLLRHADQPVPARRSRAQRQLQQPHRTRPLGTAGRDRRRRCVPRLRRFVVRHRSRPDRRRWHDVDVLTGSMF